VPWVALLPRAGPWSSAGKNYTEQLLMAEMTAALLRAKGIPAEKRDGLASALLRQAQEGGEVDVYWEYTGTSLVVYNKVEERLSAEQTYERVKELDAKKGLVWLERSQANDTYADRGAGGQGGGGRLPHASRLARAVAAGRPSSSPPTASSPARRRAGWPPAGLRLQVPRTGIVLMDPGSPTTRCTRGGSTRRWSWPPTAG
jgi:hypothetical protein